MELGPSGRSRGEGSLVGGAGPAEGPVGTHRWRFRLRHVMAAVLLVAVGLGAIRAASRVLPHIGMCRALARREDQLSRAYQRAARRYATCVQTVPCAPTDHCGNACLPHRAAPVPGRAAPTAADRFRVADAHRRAAQDHERAGRLHARMAGRYLQAQWRWSQPLPTWSAKEQSFENMFDLYQCDTF